MRVECRSKEELPDLFYIERGCCWNLMTAPAKAPVIVHVWIGRTINGTVHIEHFSLQGEKVVAVSPTDEQTHRDRGRQGFILVSRDVDDLRWGNINNPCAPGISTGTDDAIRQPAGIVVHFCESNSCILM